MQAVICVNRYRRPKPDDPPEAKETDSQDVPDETPAAEAPEPPAAPEADESLSEDEVLEAVSQEELRGYQEILESSEDEEDEEPKENEELKEEVEEVEEAEEAEEGVEAEAEAVQDDNATSAASVEVAEAIPEEADASEVSSDSEGNELDLENYEISDDDDEEMEPVDVSDADDDLDFDDFDGEDDFEEDLDLEDYEEEDDLGPLKQGFSTWLACWDQELPSRLAKPGAAQSLRERLLEALRKETGSKSTVEVNRFSLQWEHSLVFDDCPPLLGFVSIKDAEALRNCRSLADLKLKFAWSEETAPAVDDEPASPGYRAREIRLDRSRSRDRSRSAERPWSSMRYFDDRKLRSARSEPSLPRAPRGQPRQRQRHIQLEPVTMAMAMAPEPMAWCKDIMSFPEEGPKVALDKNGVLVVYKPAFWTMTTCQDGERVISRHSALQDWIRNHMGHRYKFLYTNDRAGLIHRLDVQTSGPIVCGSTPKAFKHLRESLHYHKFYKEYIALMHGALPVRQCCGEMDYPLLTTRERGYSGWRTCVDPHGQHALTRYEAVAAYKYSEGHGKTQRCTLVRLQLITGKTHQIRVHLMELARRNNLKTHGIVGDYKYLPPRNLKLDKRICRRVFLHCYRLHFPMPDAEDENLCKVRCPLPSELQEALKQIDLDKDLTENYRKQCRRHHVMASDDMIDPKKYLNIPGLVDYDYWRER